MAAILADDNFKFIFLNENDRNPIRISLKGDKPLPESMLTEITEAYMRH